MSHNELAEGYMKYLVDIGMHNRYGDNIPRDVLDRLDVEYDVIVPNKFTDYILMIWDIHDFCRTPKRVREFCATKGLTPPKDGIIPVGPGRGSAGGSMVCYCLGITQCDPLLFGLFFERFLNPERIAYPDIDYDISQRYRHLVIAYIADIYGVDHVAQIITYGTLAKNTVVHDVLQSANVSNSTINMVKATIPDDASITLQDCIEQQKDGSDSIFIKALKSVQFPSTVITIDKSNINKVASNNKYGIENMATVMDIMNGTMKSAQIEIKSTWDHEKALAIMLRLEGLNKNESTHAGGVVVAPVELESNIPLMRAKGDGVLACQYDMRSLEAIGYLKMDALGLRTVDVNHNAELLVREWYNPDFRLDDIRYDDKNAIKLINDGYTIGIFQVESSGFTQMMKDLDIGGNEVTRFADRDNSKLSWIEGQRGLEIKDFTWISAGLALYRPGPLDAVIDGKTMVQHLVDRKAGKEPVVYLFPEEKGYLEETYGILVYQEQVMARVRQMTGCSYGRADILRKAMGKKDAVLMKEQMDWLYENAMSHNFSDSELFKNQQHKANIVVRACDEIEKFARYGFNKAHTVEYAIICYDNAYLKANYPDCFYTALINSIDKPERQTIIIRDMLNHNIELLPPDINESDVEFTMVDKNSIRFGLSAIQQFGEKAVTPTVADRTKNGKYKSVEEFRIRVSAKLCNKTVMTNLAKCGAFDSLLINDFDCRATLVDSMDNLCKYMAKFTKKKNKDTPAPTSEEAINKWINSSLSYEVVRGEHDPIQYSIWEKEVLKYYISAHPIDRYEDEIRRWNAIQNTDDEDLPNEFYVAGFIEGCHECVVKKEGRNKGKKMGFVTVGTAFRIYEATMFPGIYESCLPYIKTGNPVILKGRRDSFKDKISIQCEYIRNMSNEGIRDCPECHIRLNNSDDILSIMQLKQMFDEHFGMTKVFIHVIEESQDITIQCGQTIALNDRIINFVESVGSLGYKDI